MTKGLILAAKIDYLHSYANKQFSDQKGFKLNSKDWKAYVNVKNQNFYSFLKNGSIEFTTKTTTSGQTYKQHIQLKNFKRLESILFVLFICKIPDDKIGDFLKLYMSSEDVNIDCSCEAFSKWGPHYNLTKIDSNYGEGEFRPPEVRDKTNLNLVCKHLWIVLNNYVEQVGLFAVNLIPYYKRYFNVESVSGVERIKKQMTNKGFKKIFQQTFVELSKINNSELMQMYNDLFKKSINEINKFASETAPNEPEEEKIEDEAKNENESENLDKETTEPYDEEFNEDLIDNSGALSAKRILRKNKLLGIKKF